MFSRALLVALCIVYATSSLTPLAPLSATADDDCALYLTGPGRSSAYDYSLNLLKGNFAYDGQHTCITYEAINQAYLDARNRILVSQPKGDWKAEDFASVGELILDISISLARTYGLTYEEIEKGLPLIDTSRTLIREVCPPVFSHVECRAGKYRRLDGLCNNLKHPTWGATMAPFQRLIGPLFSDGINAPRISHSGRDLPLSRVVSRTMHPDDGFHDHAGTVMVIAWGQFMDHDYTLTGTPLDPVHRNDPEECCKRPLHLKHPYCNEILVPGDDYFYRLFGVKCIDFVRGFPSPRPGCRLGSRIPFNTLTGAIDGNTVYGVTEKFARKLRTGYGGLLRMNPVFKEYGLKDLLPLKLDIPDEGCTRPNKNMYCFEAGEIRVNEQLVLTVMHTLMAREHNRVAEALAHVNPHWDDESLFQEARRINIAEIQHITYNEFLPILLGKDVMEKFGLVLAKEGYWEGYDEEVNPDVIASFAAAAYRFGHSLLPTAVERWSKAHKFIASKRLSDLIRRPYDLYRAGVLDEYVMGLMNQVAQAMDDSITQEVTNHLFKKVGARFGMDLVSFNMQRGREFGLPGYMEFRKFCGLSGADTFQDLFGSMANETIRKYESIFEHPIDVDLWSGGVSERPLPGSMLGPTFACIIATQFSYSRRGDRFWFELPNQPSSFTHEQLAEIRKSRLARVICDNTDIIDTVQLYPMVLPDHELNPRVPCRSGIIPSMDFSKWADPVPYLGGAKEYMTHAYTLNGTAGQNNQAEKMCKNLNQNCASNETSNINSLNNGNSTDFTLLIKDKESDNLCFHAENNTNCLNKTTLNNCQFEQNCKNQTLNQNEGLANLVKESTTIKYEYKKKDDIKAFEKLKGHYKNSLKRKKRSFNRNIENSGQSIADGIYDVIKDQNIERGELNLPKFNPSDIIKSSEIADFKGEVLHKKDKPDHQLQRNEQKYFDPINNNRYIPIRQETGDTKYNENTSYQDENVNETPRQFIPASQKQLQDYHDDMNSKRNSPRAREYSEKKDQESSSYQDENDEESNEDNKNDERLHENLKAQNNVLPRGNIRYYKDRKNKYHISKPKNLNQAGIENEENDSRESINNSSLEEEDEDIRDKKFKNDDVLDEKKTKPLSQSSKEGYGDHTTKQADKDKFSFSQEDETDEESDESFKSKANLHVPKQLPENNLHRHNEKYYKNHKNSPKSKKPNDYSDDSEDDYENDEDEEDENDHGNFKQDERAHVKKLSPDGILERHNQQYNDKRNKYFLSALKNKDEKHKEHYGKVDKENNGYSNDNLHSDKNSNEKQQPHNNLHYSNHRNYSPEHQKLDKESNESNESQVTSKENKYKENEEDDGDERTEDFKNGSGIDESEQPRHELRKQNQLYYNKNNKYPLLQSETPNAASDENNERQGANYESEHKDDEGIKNYNKNRGLTANIEEKPLHSFSSEDFHRENSKENDEYTRQPLPRNNGKTNRLTDIHGESNINNEKPHVLAEDRSIYRKNTNFDGNPKVSFRDNRQKETQISNDNYNNSPEIKETYDKSKEIENDDLNNFSYDKFRGDIGLGNIDPKRVSHENYESDSLARSTTIKPKIKKKKKSKPGNIKKPIKLNKQVPIRGVAKSLIERTNENRNKESKKNSNENLSGNYESAVPNRANYRKIDSIKKNEKGNVKQDFERIPLDYIRSGSDKKKSTAPVKNIESEGTLDTLSPKNDKYDENLKTKFGDINIKLPEIRLPEDILEYTQAAPENNKDKAKTNFYNYDAGQYTQKPHGNAENIHHYDPTDATVYSQQPKPKQDKPAEGYDFFASYINKPHEETKTDDAGGKSDVEDGEDLYERFVRERFGRKDSFKERSENLQEKKGKLQESKPITKNKELFANIQKAIKKAEEVQKEAEKSKDPKANYLWTLEYGEKL